MKGKAIVEKKRCELRDVVDDIFSGARPPHVSSAICGAGETVYNIERIERIEDSSEVWDFGSVK